MKFKRVETTVHEQNDFLDFDCPICGETLQGHYVNRDDGSFQGYQRCEICRTEFAWVWDDEFVCYSREVM